MRSARLAPLFVVVCIVAPAVVLSWGNIEDIRYKMKSQDGNLWESKLGRGYLVKGDEHPGAITFTFDDGPDHRTTPILLNQLDRYGVKATFFINGAKIHYRTAGGPENQAVLRDIFRRGHFIGNHTFNHKDITTLNDQGWRTEVLQVEQVVRGIIGRRPWLFRPPFGRIENPELERLSLESYTVVMWNLDPLDWKAKNGADLLRRCQNVIDENPTGGVFLMHDTNRSTVEAFPLLIEWLEERNARLRAEGGQTLEIVGLEHFIHSKKR